MFSRNYCKKFEESAGCDFTFVYSIKITYTRVYGIFFYNSTSASYIYLETMLYSTLLSVGVPYGIYNTYRFIP